MLDLTLSALFFTDACALQHNALDNGKSRGQNRLLHRFAVVAADRGLSLRGVIANRPSVFGYLCLVVQPARRLAQHDPLHDPVLVIPQVDSSFRLLCILRQPPSGSLWNLRGQLRFRLVQGLRPNEPG